MARNTNTRRKVILETLRAEGFCSVTALAKHLDVSEVTVRTDLTALEEQGEVTRIHGGAVLAPVQPRSKRFDEQSRLNEDKKRRIARYAAELVDDYDSIILDASTTVYHMADYLRDHQGLTVFTNGIEAAFRLASNPSTKVILTGGLLRLETASLGAPLGIGSLSGIHANKAFVSCTGWSLDLDLMDDDLFEVQIKRDMCERAESIIAIVDSTKFGRQGLASFVNIRDITRVITDDGVSESQLLPLRKAGVPIMICKDHSTQVLEAASGDETIRIGFANQDDSAPFSTLVRQGLLRAAAARKIDLVMTDNREDGRTALANVEYFVDQGVDLVVEFNTDARFGPLIMEKLNSANIPAIAVDIAIPGATVVGVDNYKAGRMAGTLLGMYIQKVWNGTVDKVLSLELPLAGSLLAARMEGQIDGFREYIDVRDEDILHIDSQNTFAKAHHAVAELLPALRSAGHIAVLSVNDEVALGAQAAFEEAGQADRVLIVSFGADQAAAKDLQRPASRLVGAVASFPERYGELILSVAIDLLHSKAVPPAVYTNHIWVLPEKTTEILGSTRLPYEFISASEFADTQSKLGSQLTPVTYRNGG
ncbi:MAG: substrate-binding domain-containing protein [Anaerolineae bacterium]